MAAGAAARIVAHDARSRGRKLVPVRSRSRPITELLAGPRPSATPIVAAQKKHGAGRARPPRLGTHRVRRAEKRCATRGSNMQICLRSRPWLAGEAPARREDGARCRSCRWASSDALEKSCWRPATPRPLPSGAGPSFTRPERLLVRVARVTSIDYRSAASVGAPCTSTPRQLRPAGEIFVR